MSANISGGKASAGATAGQEKDYSMTENDKDRILQELMSRIERTEAEMTETLDAIQERLSLDYLKNRAEEKILTPALKEAGVMIEKANQMVKGVGEVSMQLVNENPLPVALIGLGLGWLALKSLTNTSEGVGELSQGSSEAGFLPEELYQAGLEEPGSREYREGGNLSAQRSGRGVLGFLEENLLAVGIAALVVGAGIGFLLPRVQRKSLSTGTEGDRFSEAAQGGERLAGEAAREWDLTEGLHSLEEVEAEGPYATQRQYVAETSSEGG